jgi:hypothetical protein
VIKGLDKEKEYFYNKTGIPSLMEKESIKNRPEGITLLAALFWILAILALVGSLFIVVTKDAIIEFIEDQPEVTEEIVDLVDSVLMGTGIIIFVLALLYIITGWGLWTLKSWARIVALILAVISLLSFPIGTIIGIVVLWYLFKPEIKKAFQQ